EAPSYGDDAAVLDAEIGSEAIGAGAVDDLCAGDDDVQLSRGGGLQSGCVRSGHARQRVDPPQPFLPAEHAHDGGAARQRYPFGGAGRDELGVGLVHGREVRAVGQVDAQHDHVVEARASGGDDGVDVLEGAQRLGFDVAAVEVLP